MSATRLSVTPDTKTTTAGTLSVDALTTAFEGLPSSCLRSEDHAGDLQFDAGHQFLFCLDFVTFSQKITGPNAHLCSESCGIKHVHIKSQEKQASDALGKKGPNESAQLQGVHKGTCR